MTPPSKKSGALLRVLMVEDNPSDARLLMHELKRLGREVRLDVVTTREGLLAALRGSTHDVVLSDYNLGGWTGLDVLQVMQQQFAPQPFILVTGSLGDEKAAECIKLGAADFVLKDRLNRLPYAIERALKEKKLREQRLAAEQALRESEERYRQLFESSPQPMWVYDRETLTFLAVNEAAIRGYGYSREEFLSMTIAEIRPPEDVPRLLQSAHQELGESLEDAGEWRHRRKDGSLLDVAITSHSIEWGGRPAELVLATNITERKRAEEALQKSEANFRSLVTHAPYGICRANAQGTRLTAVNPAVVEMLGYSSEEEVLALDLPTDVFPGPVEHAKVVETASRGEDFHHLETDWKRKDGKVISVRGSGRAIRDAAEVRRFEWMVEDVTAQRELEQQLRQAQKMEAVGRLAGGIAHDFNNLLTVIRGYAELMLEEPDREKTRRHAQNIMKASDRTAALTRQLLAFSRKQVLWPQVLDLNAVVAETQKMLPPLIGEDVLVIVIPGPRLGRVKADPGQLEQVLMNLAINARDAMPRGGKLVLETSNVECDEGYCATHPGARPGSYVMLAVSDNGCGMDQEIQSHIFEPFFTTKTKEKGTGLGLATAYGIIKQSGGHIWVYSEPGIGTTFKVYLPRVDEKAAATPPPSRFEEKAAVTETLLVVEDEEGVRHLTRMFLEQRGYRVLEARNGAEALELAAAHAGPIHLLVTDIVMPGMRGRELAEKLCSARPQAKVLYVSGYTDGSILESGELGPGAAFLEKPFSSDALARKVRQVLNGAGSGCEPPAGPDAAEPVEKQHRMRM